MRRLYEPYAYSDAPLETCLWNETPLAPGYPPQEGSHKADIAIIGGGYTGLSAALHLAQAGEDVTLLEARHLGWGASGRNGGFCCLGGGKISNSALEKLFGLEGRAEYRRAERGAFEFTEDLISSLNLDVDRHSKGETALAHRFRHWEGLKSSAAEVEADYGVKADLIPKEELRQNGLAGPFHGAMTIPLGFGLNPRKYITGLIQAARDAGAQIFEQSPVTQITPEGQGYSLTTPQGTLKAKRIILATNGYSSEDVPHWLRARLLPLQSNVLATRPLTLDELSAAGWTSDQMAYDTRTLLHYFRKLPDGRFLFGMRGGVYATPRATARLRAKIVQDFHTMFPAWKEVEIPYLWSGLVCLNANQIPFIGAVPEMPGAFAGLSYHGNGIAMGTYAGRLLADLVRGKMPELPYPQAFQTPPRRIPLGRHRRLWLAAANAYYGLKDG